MERLKELCKGFDQRDIRNMDESGCFFKALPGLAQKGKKAKGGKKSKQKIAVAFFVYAVRRKLGELNKKSICFRLASAPVKVAEDSYFDDSKSWKLWERSSTPLIFK